MISKNRIKLIKSLIHKKTRDLTGLFLVEGDKICLDLLKSHYTIETVYFTETWGSKNYEIINALSNRIEFISITDDELLSISLLTTPNQVLALVRQKSNDFNWSYLSDAPVLLLDQVQDPGNLGTIIRTADWFGFRTIIGSPNTVDIYNSKVVQAAMGSAFRVEYFKYDLELLLKENIENHKWPVYATVLSKKSIYNCRLLKKAFYIFGNEANGVSLSLQSLATELIAIPNNSLLQGKNGVDSLNIAIAAAIVMAEFNRQNNL